MDKNRILYFNPPSPGALADELDVGGHAEALLAISTYLAVHWAEVCIYLNLPVGFSWRYGADDEMTVRVTDHEMNYLTVTSEMVAADLPLVQRVKPRTGRAKVTINPRRRP